MAYQSIKNPLDLGHNTSGITHINVCYWMLSITKMTINELLQDIQKSDNVKKHYDFVDKCLTDNPELIQNLFSEIPKDWNFLLKNWQLRALYEKIIKSTCMNSGERYIRLASHLFSEIDRELDQLRIGSYLAFTQNSNELIETLLKLDNKQLLLLSTHELISRGKSFSEHKNIKELAKINADSEFKKLELFPSPLELSNTFPHYTNDGSSSSPSFGFAYDEEYLPINKNSKEKITYSQNSLIEKGLSHWTDQSGGIAIGYNGELNHNSTIESSITALPEFSESTGIRIKQLNSRDAYCRVFDAISKGAAYSSGEYGAIGRLKSWLTISQLIEKPIFRINSEISSAMDKYNWYEFNTDSWFINEWCDFGIYCQNIETGNFGLLAATDTD